MEISGLGVLLSCSIMDHIAQNTFSNTDTLHKYWLVFQFPDILQLARENQSRTQTSMYR